MKQLLLTTCLLAALHTAAFAQPHTTPPSRVTLNLFRAPSTGLEYRVGWFGGRVSFHAGYYPTVIKREGKNRSTHFIAIGNTFYFKPEGSTFYTASSYAISLSGGWKDSWLNEVGYKWQISPRWAFRGGAVLLVTGDYKEVRLNPTLGFGMSL